MDLFGKLSSLTNRKKSQQEQSGGGNIVIIGPRSSGKTTYLAALAYWPKRLDVVRTQNEQQQYFLVQPLNDDAQKLQEKAHNIIVRGESFRATKVTPQGQDIQEMDDEQLTQIEQLPTYSFNIEINPKFGKSESINLVVKDYAGELFDDHLDSQTSHTFYQNIWEDSLSGDVEGSLLLLSGWTDEDDEKYSQNVDKFLELMDREGRSENYRLAIGMSKCERGELWPGRVEPIIDIFKQHLPRTTATLKNNLLPENLRFYALSTFGVLGEKDPRPNRKDLSKQGAAALREPKQWRPYNLITPLYWLGTGKDALFLSKL